MRRREFITGLGSAAAWPVVARAQQFERVRQVGVLLGWSESDPEWHLRFGAFVDELARLGWRSSVNLQIEQRWINADISRVSSLAKELVDWRPDVILSGGTPATAALKHETRTIPIVGVVLADPVGSGFVASLPRPGGNITAFCQMEGSMVGKWLQIIKEIAPHIRRAALMYNPDTAPFA
jgi:putative ABC transport system substrate-binding protein